MSESLKTRNKNVLYWTVICVCLVTGIGSLGFYFLAPQIQAQSLRASSKGGPRYRFVATPQTRQAHLERTKQIREKLKTWAYKHRAALARLRSSDGTDTTVLRDVLNRLPYSPNYEGTNFTYRDLLHSGSPQFISRTGSYRFQITTADRQNKRTLGRLNATTRFERQMQSEFFRQYKDIAFLTTDTQGPITYTLWASGRITEATQALLRTKEGEELQITAQHIEVVPPFDFIASTP